MAFVWFNEREGSSGKTYRICVGKNQGAGESLQQAIRVKKQLKDENAGPVDKERRFFFSGQKRE